MALKPVTDPNTLATLRQPVSDEALLAQLNAPERAATLAPAPVAETPPGGYAQPYAYFTPEVQRNLGNTGEDLQPVVGAGETALNVGTGALATALGGAAGLGNVIWNNSPIGLLAHHLGMPESDPADVVHDFQHGLTYQPRTFAGQVGQQAVSDAFDPEVGTSKLNPLTYPGRLGEVLGDASEAVGLPPLVSAMLKMAPDAVTAWFAPKLGEALDASRAASAEKAATEAAAVRAKLPRGAQLARDADIAILPSDLERIAGQKPPGTFAESLAPSDIGRLQTLKNQPKFNDMAADDLGVPKGTHLDEPMLDKLDEPHINTYREVEQIAGKNPPLQQYTEAIQNAISRVPKFVQMVKRGLEPPSVTQLISTLRRRGAKATQSELRDTEFAGYDDLEAAHQLEDALGDQLKAAGDKNALTRYQDAREAMAKINNVRQASREGQVDPQLLLEQKNRGAPLTGNLAAMADMAEGVKSLRSSMTSAGDKAHGKGLMTKARDLGSAIARKVTGQDVLSDKVQNKIGPSGLGDDLTNYKRGPVEEAPPEQQEMLGSYFEPDVSFTAPEGEIGRLPPKPMPTEQTEALGPGLDLRRPKGFIGDSPSDFKAAQESYIANEMPALNQGNLELGNALSLKAQPGRVGKPKGGVDVRTGTKGAKSKKQIDEMLTLTPEEEAYLKSILGE